MDLLDGLDLGVDPKLILESMNGWSKYQTSISHRDTNIGKISSPTSKDLKYEFATPTPIPKYQGARYSLAQNPNTLAFAALQYNQGVHRFSFIHFYRHDIESLFYVILFHTAATIWNTGDPFGWFGNPNALSYKIPQESRTITTAQISLWKKRYLCTFGEWFPGDKPSQHGFFAFSRPLSMMATTFNKVAQRFAKDGCSFISFGIDNCSSFGIQWTRPGTRTICVFKSYPDRYFMEDKETADGEFSIAEMDEIFELMRDVGGRMC